jgi:hypothetical protein
MAHAATQTEAGSTPEQAKGHAEQQTEQFEHQGQRAGGQASVVRGLLDV